MDPIKKDELLSPQMKAGMDKAGISLDDILRGAKAFLPILKLIANRTPNKFDDAFVSWLEAIVAAETA